MVTAAFWQLGMQITSSAQAMYAWIDEKFERGLSTASVSSNKHHKSWGKNNDLALSAKVQSFWIQRNLGFLDHIHKIVQRVHIHSKHDIVSYSNFSNRLYFL